MEPLRSMPTRPSYDTPGSDREPTSLAGAGDSVSRAEAQRARIDRRQRELRALFARMVQKAGGADWLTAMLDQRPSYMSKIVEALHGSDDRKVQLDWLAPLLEDAAAAELLLTALSDWCGFESPVRRRVVSREQLAAAAAEVVAETSGAMKDAMREAIAKKLGVRPEDVKL